jgi:hypothetical protein
MFHGLKGAWLPRKPEEAVTVRHEGTPGSEMRQVLESQIRGLAVEMSAKTCAPELSTAAGRLPDNTVRLIGVATPITIWTFPKMPEQRRPIGLIMNIQFPYKYDQTEINPPEADVPQGPPVGSMPGPISGPVVGLNPPLNPAKMKVTLKRKPLELKYEPLSSDMLGETAFKEGRTHVTDYYATVRPGGGSLLHGNNRTRVMVDGNDASTSFAVSRFLTDWVQPINQTGQRVGNIRGGGWRLDTSLASGGWVDIPGQTLPGSPNTWPQQRYMQEYLVGVNGFPEFGGLYFIVIVDTKPNEYRVRMYPAKKITINEWCAIKTRNRPYQDETSSGAAVVDSGPLVVR